MNGIAAAFIAMLCWAFGDFFIQKTVRRIGNIESLALSGIIGALALFPLVIGELSSLLQLSNLMLLGVLGVITFVAAILNFEALKQGKLSVIEVILEIELPITVILSIAIYGEVLAWYHYLLMLVIFAGIILMSTKSLQNPFKSFERGVIIGIVAAIGMGTVNFLTAASAKEISPLMAIWGPWVIYGLLSCLVICQREGLAKFTQRAKKWKWIILGMAVFDTLAWLFYAVAVVEKEIAITTAITESYPALTLFLGLWLNAEKISKNQYIGAALALIGSISLALI